MQFSDLLDQSFPVPAGRHYFDDFPVWNPQLGAEGVFRPELFQEGQLIAAGGVRLAALKRPGAKNLKIALIGAVVTNASDRGKGLASDIVSRCVDWAREQGAEIVLLWGSEHHLYQRLGFELTGNQVQFSLEKIMAPNGPRLVQVHRGWIPGLFKLLQERSTGLILKESDRRWYEAHRNVEWFFTGSPDQPTAYAAYGRGIDLPGLIHEWGGDPGDLHEILKQIHLEKPHAMLLGPPESQDQIQAELIPVVRDPLCMAKFLRGTKPSSPFPFWVWGLDAA